ncbi:MAG: PEP-CTERM sorting domain-containing protein [Pseudomonadales bacterium]|jgi:hypothetical protein
MVKSIKTKIIASLSLVCLLGVLSPLSHATVIQIFDGVGAGDLRADWEAAVNHKFSEEDFNDGSADGFSFSRTGGGHTGFGISSDRFNDRLRNNTTTTFTFDVPIYAFGANFDLSPGGAGLGLIIVAGTETLAVEIPSTFSGEFFGFVTDTLITSVTLRSGTQSGGAETYNLDNLVYRTPEPGILALMGLGLAAFGLTRRRQRG